jgi:hypothetical protein
MATTIQQRLMQFCGTPASAFAACALAPPFPFTEPVSRGFGCERGTPSIGITSTVFSRQRPDMHGPETATAPARRFAAQAEGLACCSRPQQVSKHFEFVLGTGCENLLRPLPQPMPPGKPGSLPGKPLSPQRVSSSVTHQP